MKSPWMPDYLGGSLRTLGALPGANAPRSPGELQAEFLANQDRMKLADALASQGYVQNSGALGSIAQIFGAWSGGKIKKEEQKKLAELLREESDMLSASERRKLEDQAKAEEAKFQRELEKIAFSEKTKAQNRAPARPRFSNGLIFDPNTSEVTKTPFYREPQAQGADTPASIRELEAYMQMTPEQQKAYDRLQGREVGPAQLSAKDQQAQAIRGVSADQADTLLQQLEGYTKAGVGGPIEGRLPAILSPSNEEYESVRAQLVDEISRLRRVPGIGAQSDLELRTALAAIPGVETNEETRKKAFANLRQVIAKVRQELGGSSGGISGGIDASGWSIQAVD
jgi:hypothetical protein